MSQIALNSYVLNLYNNNVFIKILKIVSYGRLGRRVSARPWDQFEKIIRSKINRSAGCNSILAEQLGSYPGG